METRSRELAKRIEQKTHQLAALNTISAVVNSSLDLTEILNSALKKTIEVVHMDVGLAFSVEEASPGIMDEPYIRMLAHQGVSEEHARENRIVPLRSTLVYKAVQAGRPLIFYDNTHPDLHVQKYHDREGLRMSISIPLLVKGKLVGTIAMAAREPREITAEELSLLEAIGQQVGMAVVNARMYEQAEQTAIATERNRLARELHDSVTQLLYSVGLYAEAASELLETGDIETAASHLREVRDTSQEALREMRLLIFELHRPAIGESGLAGALQTRLDAVERRGGMHAELAVDGREKIPRLIQEELYNIAREALNNALKHAHANSIRIQLCFGKVETAMEIHDDGVGFEPAEDDRNGGFGIQGMRERCQKINGTLQIISAPGKGTTILVRVPILCPEYISPTQNELAA